MGLYPALLNAQVNIDTPNLSFDDGSLNGWKLYTGDFFYDNISGSYEFNWTPKTPAQTGNRISVIGNTSTTNDPIIACSGFYTNPVQKVARIGEPLKVEGRFSGSANAAAERMEYSFKVTPNTTLLSYKLAAVLRVPPADTSHVGEQRPTFSMEISVKDDNGISYILPCSGYSSKADNGNTSLTPNGLPCLSSAAGTNAKDYVYQKWISGNIDLSKQIGKTVTINVINHDCLSTSGGTLHAGAHEAYGYFWAETKKIELTASSCENSDAIIVAPQGFSSYNWTRSDGKTMNLNPVQPWIATVDKSLNFDGITYYCEMNEVNSLCGGIVVSKKIDQVKLYPDFSSVAVDAGKIQFTNTSTAVGDSITDYYWEFGDGTTSNLPNPIHEYTQFIPFDVKLTVTSKQSCTKFKTRSVSPTKELIATITPTANLVYNGQTKDFTATTNIAGLQMNIDYYIRYTNKPGTPFYSGYAAPATVGNYTATFELSYLSLLKYFMNSVPSKDFTITKAPLVVTVNNISKTYGENISLLRDAFTQDMKPLYAGDKIYELELNCNGLKDTSTVGTYIIKADSAIGLGVRNYDIQFVSGTLTVNPKPLIISAVDNIKTYGEKIIPIGTEFFVNQGSLVGTDSIKSVTFQCDGFDLPANVASYTITPMSAIGFRLNNYNITYKPAVLLVNKKKISIAAQKLTKIYGTDYSFQGNEFNVDKTQFVENDSILHLQFASQATAKKAQVGEYNLSITGISGNRLDNYEIAYANNTFVVQPMPITIIPQNLTKEYGDLMTFVGGEFSTDKPLISGDTISFVMLKSSGSIQTAPIGNYEIMASLAYGAGTLNYDFKYYVGTLSVVKKKIEATLVPPTYLSYNCRTKDVIANIKVSGLLLNADYSIRYTNQSGTPNYNSVIAPVAAGNYTATFELSAASLLKYYLDATPTINFSISKAPLTITADNIEKIYGDSVSVNLLKYAFKTDMKQMYDADRIDEIEFVACDGMKKSATTGTYTLIPNVAKGQGVNNYEINFIPGKLTIHPKNLTIKVLNSSKIYGDSIELTAQNFYVNPIDLVANDTVLSVKYNSTGFNRLSSTGLYPVMASDAVGRGLNNYVVTYSDATLQVLKKDISILVQPVSKMYGTEYIFKGDEFSTDFSVFVGADSIASVQLSSTGTVKNSVVGNYNIAIDAIVGVGLENYNINKVSNIFSVTPMPIKVSPKDICKSYGELFTFTGKEFTTDKPLINGDTISFVLLKSSGCAENSPVADYDIFASQVYGVGIQNYDFTYLTGKLSVVQKAITANIYAPEYLVYNAKNKEFLASVSVPELNKNTDYFIHYSSKDGTYDSYIAPYKAGEYTATFELSSLSMLKYKLTEVPSKEFVITKAPLTITADNATKTYGQHLNLQNTAFAADMKPLFGNDVILGVYSNCAGLIDTACVKTYDITPANITGSGLENYEITFVNGILSVIPKRLTIKAVDATKIYGDVLFPNPKSFYVDSHELVGTDMVNTVSLYSDGFEASATTGTYPIKASKVEGVGMENYLISYEDGRLQIQKKKINVSAKPIYKVYGCEHIFKGDEFETAQHQFIGSDKITTVKLNSQGAKCIASVGEYSLSISDIFGNGLENYDIITQNGVMFVTPKPIVIIGDDLEKEFGDVMTFSGNEFTTDIALSNNDSITFAFLRSNGSAETAPIGVYDILPAQATGVGSLNYSISYRPGKLSVVQKQLKVVAQNCVKEYGENDPTQSFTVSDKRGVEFQPTMFSGKMSREPGENVGVYTISKGSLSVTPSYAFTFVNGNLTIKKALPTIEPYFTNTGGEFVIIDVLGSKNGNKPEGNVNVKISQTGVDNTILVNNGSGKCAVSGLPEHMVEAEFYYQGDNNYLPATKTMKIYAIVYHTNGGNLVSAIRHFDGNESVKLENPTQDNNFVFEGWYDNETFSGEPLRRIPVGTYHDVHLYAKWSVTYDDLSIVPLFNQVLAVANPLNRSFIYNSTFKWYKDDVLLNSEKQYCGFENYIPSGSYRVEIYYLNNAPIVLELVHTAVMQKAKVYPNPILRQSELSISTDLVKQEGVVVEVYDLLGVRQSSVSIELDDDRFRLNGFADAGLYIIRIVQNGNVKEIFKVMVED